MASSVQWAATGLSNLVQGHGGLQPVALPKEPHPVFKENLLKIAALDGASGKKELINGCIEAIHNDLATFDFTFSEQAQNMLNNHLTTFNSAVDQTSGLDAREIKALKREFKQLSANEIKNFWVADAALKFYSILFLADSKERILAAQGWAEQFLKGVSSLEKLKFDGHCNDYLPESFIKNTQDAFKVYYEFAMEIKGNSMLKLANSQKDAFDILEKKAKNNPNSLSSSERELVECLSHAVSMCLMYTPCLNKKVVLLRDCVVHGYTVQALGLSITENEESWKRFSTLFAEQEEFEKTFVFQSTSSSEVLRD